MGRIEVKKVVGEVGVFVNNEAGFDNGDDGPGVGVNISDLLCAADIAGLAENASSCWAGARALEFMLGADMYRGSYSWKTAF